MLTSSPQNFRQVDYRAAWGHCQDAISEAADEARDSVLLERPGTPPFPTALPSPTEKQPRSLLLCFAFQRSTETTSLTWPPQIWCFFGGVLHRISANKGYYQRLHEEKRRVVLEKALPESVRSKITEVRTPSQKERPSPMSALALHTPSPHFPFVVSISLPPDVFLGGKMTKSFVWVQESRLKYVPAFCSHERFQGDRGEKRLGRVLTAYMFYTRNSSLDEDVSVSRHPCFCFGFD